MDQCKCEIMLHHLKEMLKNNVERIDRLDESGVTTDIDIGMCYAYRKILDFIKEREEK